MLAVTGAPDGTGAVPGRRVVVTGLGVVSSCGIGVEAFWQGLFGEAPVGRFAARDGAGRERRCSARKKSAGRTALSSWQRRRPTRR